MRCPFCLNEVPSFLEEKDAHDRPVLVCPDAACREAGVPLLYVQDYAQFPAIPFSIMGLRGHGKTVFVTSLLHELSELGQRWPGFYSAPLDEESYREVEKRLAEMRAGRLPEATRMVFPRAEVIRLQNIPRVGGCHLMMFDTSGEAFLTVNGVMAYARYVKRSPSVIWLISLENMDSPDELDRVLTVYLQALAEMKGESSKQELIVVLTKGDLLLNSPKVPRLPELAEDFLLNHQLDPCGDSWLRLDQVSKELGNWIVDAGYHQFANRARDSFAAVRYCIISAQGADATNGELDFGLMPRGVLAPLFWLWRQIAPPVWVETPGEKGYQLFFTLDEALEESPAGSMIHLAAATYQPKAPLQVRKAVRIKGRGLAKTIIRGSGEGYDIAFGGGDAKLEISDVAFVHEGPKPADVFRALRGEIHIRRCSFSGGINQNREIGGDGIFLAKEVRGDIAECEINRNQGSGVTLRDDARVRLERNQIRGNGGPGILCLSSNVSELFSNECSGNQGHGIRIGLHSLARLDSNVCRGNRRSGIACTDSAQPEVRACECLGNGLNGIQIKNDAKPVLEGNHCMENKASGISYSDTALGTARDNECLDNAHCGISLADVARPDLQENRCHRNGQHGIGYTASAGGVTRENQCYANAGCGISLEMQASPTLEDNDCSGNQGHGITIAATVGKIRLRGNTGRDNRGDLMHDLRKRGWFG